MTEDQTIVTWRLMEKRYKDIVDKIENWKLEDPEQELKDLHREKLEIETWKANHS